MFEETLPSGEKLTDVINRTNVTEFIDRFIWIIACHLTVS